MAKQTRRFWTREENVCVMKCYYKSQPDERGYRKRMFAIWKTIFPDITITEQRLLDQKRSILKHELLAPLEIDNIRKSIESINNPPTLIPTYINPVTPTQEDSVSSVVINEQLDYAEDVTPLSAEESLLLLDIQQAILQFSSIESRPQLRRIYTIL